MRDRALTVLPRRYGFGLILVAVLLMGGGPAHAQSGVRSVGAVSTGGGTSVLAMGPSALYANPAALTVGPADHRVEIQVMRTSLYGGGDLLQFNHYNDHFTQGKTLDRAEVNSILRDWFNGGMRSVAVYAELVPLAVTLRPPDAQWAAGLGIRTRLFDKTTVNRGLADLYLTGTSTNRSVPVDGRYRLYSTLDITGSVSYRFSSLPLSIGVSPRLIVGTGYADGTLDSRVTVSDSTIVHTFDYAARAAGVASTELYDRFNAFGDELLSGTAAGASGVSGVGGGVDVGATYSLRSTLHVSASVTDLGRIRWTKDSQTVTPETNTFRFDGFALDLQRLDEEFGGDTGEYLTHQLDSLAREAYQDVERERSSFSTGLPTTLHVSSTWAPMGAVTLNGGVSVGLNEKAGAVPDPAAVHLGGEFDLGPVPVRLGARAWGTQAVTLSGGVGLDLGVYRLDLGASITPRTSTLGEGARYAVGLSLGTIRL